MEVSKTHQTFKKKTKKCCFPGCDNTFEGVGPSKYCEIHKQDKFRKAINKILLKRKLDRTPKLEDCNQIIKHKNMSVIEQEFKCSLEGCNNTFKVKILPRTFVYPKYCEEHRNHFKRELFLKGNTK